MTGRIASGDRATRAGTEPASSLGHTASVPCAPHKCIMIFGYCKRGHPKTRETTFERKVRSKGREYLVRECRVCHAMRYNKTPSWSRFQSKSKWSALRGKP